MTKALPFTEISVRRAIRAARKEGLAVQAVTVMAVVGRGTCRQHQAAG